MEDIVEGTITAVAFGGEGILRHEGFVYFIPFTTTGDVIRARVIEKKARFGRATLQEIIQPAPNRTEPKCPYFGRCGGCQLQYLDAEQQLRLKVLWLQDAFKRVGHLPWDLSPRGFSAKEAWYYRRHIRLTLSPTSADEGLYYQLGYQGAELGTFVPIQQCALFLPQEDPLFVCLESLMKGVAPSSEEVGSLSLMKLGENRFFSHYTFPKALSKAAHAHLLKHWKCDPRLVGVAIQTSAGCERMGEETGSFSFEGLTFDFSPFAFVQAHPTQSALLYNEVKNVVARLNPKNILDLYCGIGVTSLVGASSGAGVLGVEGNPQAIKCAKENALRNAVKGVEFLCVDVADICGAELRRSPDLVIVNPPRTGLDPRVRNALLKQPPRALLYISCMPPTMARDLSFFAKIGFTPKECVVVDLFPQTTHMETLLLLERS